MFKSSLWICLCLGLAGCSYLVPLTVSTSALDPDHEIYLGIVKGTASNGYLVGIPISDDEGMRIAMNRAKREIGADNLVNVTVDRRITYYPFTILPLYTKVETIITGTGVRYKDRSLSKIKDYTVPEEHILSTAPVPSSWQPSPGTL